MFKLSPLLFVGSAPRLLPQIVLTLEAIAGWRDAPALASLFPGPVHGNWCLGDSGGRACAGVTAVYLFPLGCLILIAPILQFANDIFKSSVGSKIVSTEFSFSLFLFKH